MGEEHDGVPSPMRVQQEQVKNIVSTEIQAVLYYNSQRKSWRILERILGVAVISNSIDRTKQLVFNQSQQTICAGQLIHRSE